MKPTYVNTTTKTNKAQINLRTHPNTYINLTNLKHTTTPTPKHDPKNKETRKKIRKKYHEK